MAEKPSHIKQLSLIHVCKIGLTSHAEMSKRSSLQWRNKTIRGGRAYGQLPWLAACHKSASVIGCMLVVLSHIRFRDRLYVSWYSHKSDSLIGCMWVVLSHIRFRDWLHVSCALTNPIPWLTSSKLYSLTNPLPRLAPWKLYSHTSASVIACMWVVLSQIRFRDWLQVSVGAQGL
jgi:hypothetical protein